MVKVITYGTYDLLHFGHIKLLERAKELGDYLIVGITADDFDKTRGKINVQQSLMERIEAVRATGIADEIIVEEYEGQKIDDIKKYGVDIFTVGSDWVGKFDYLNEYCKVVYLERTKGVSSSELREQKRSLSLGIVGDALFLNKIADECEFVNGIHVEAVCTHNIDNLSEKIQNLSLVTNKYEEMLDKVDAVYLRSQPEKHYEQIREALMKNKHILCESPVTLKKDEFIELKKIADERGLILMEAIKTAYSTAYQRLLLLLKGGKIGDIVSVDATCTSIRDDSANTWRGIYEWGPTALLPVFQILGTDYTDKNIVVKYHNKDKSIDSFVKSDFIYKNAVASIKIGDGVKSEGELVISGTKGYVYVPAPWWKTDYFEIRFENSNDNKRYFYQLDGEGIRYELVSFTRSIENGRELSNISMNITAEISQFMDDQAAQSKTIY